MSVLLRIKFPKHYPMIYKTLLVPLSFTVSEAIAYIVQEQLPHRHHHNHNHQGITAPVTVAGEAREPYGLFIRNCSVWLQRDDNRPLSDYAEQLEQAVSVSTTTFSLIFLTLMYHVSFISLTGRSGVCRDIPRWDPLDKR